MFQIQNSLPIDPGTLAVPDVLEIFPEQQETAEGKEEDCRPLITNFPHEVIALILTYASDYPQEFAKLRTICRLFRHVFNEKVNPRDLALAWYPQAFRHMENKELEHDQLRNFVETTRRWDSIFERGVEAEEIKSLFLGGGFIDNGITILGINLPNKLYFINSIGASSNKVSSTSCYKLVPFKDRFFGVSHNPYKLFVFSDKGEEIMCVSLPKSIRVSPNRPLEFFFTNKHGYLYHSTPTTHHSDARLCSELNSTIILRFNPERPEEFIEIEDLSLINPDLGKTIGVSHISSCSQTDHVVICTFNINDTLRSADRTSSGLLFWAADHDQPRWHIPVSNQELLLASLNSLDETFCIDTYHHTYRVTPDGIVSGLRVSRPLLDQIKHSYPKNLAHQAVMIDSVTVAFLFKDRLVTCNTNTGKEVEWKPEPVKDQSDTESLLDCHLLERNIVLIRSSLESNFTAFNHRSVMRIVDLQSVRQISYSENYDHKVSTSSNPIFISPKGIIVGNAQCIKTVVWRFPNILTPPAARVQHSPQDGSNSDTQPLPDVEEPKRKRHRSNPTPEKDS